MHWFGIRRICLLLFSVLQIALLPTKGFSSTPNKGSAEVCDDGEFSRFTAMSWEDASLTPVLRQGSSLIVRFLIDHETRNIGGLDLVELDEELRSVRWMFTEESMHAGPKATRNSGVYSVLCRTVILSKPDFALMDPAVRSVALLHEALGALGYYDESYQITTLLATYSTLLNVDSIRGLSAVKNRLRIDKMLGQVEVEMSLRSRLRTNLTPTYQTRARGGITGFGGGGDQRMLTTKIMLLIYLPIALEEVDPRQTSLPRLFKDILDSEIENDASPRKSGSFEGLLSRTDARYSGSKLVITVPDDVHSYMKNDDHSLFIPYFRDLYRKIIIAWRKGRR